MEELHLVVLWENARKNEARILADLRRHVRIVASFMQRWPGDPRAGYARFYGAKASLAAGKVESCGGGEFRTLIVCDERPRYGWKKTSRGTELVNLRMFAMKQRYRKWAGGGHCVHSTNSVLEAERDIYLLTGRKVEDWRNNTAVDGLEMFCADSGCMSDPGAAIKEAIEPTLADAAKISDLCRRVFPVKDLQSPRLVRRIEGCPFHELVFDARTLDDVPCTVTYMTFGRDTLVTDWDFGRKFCRCLPQNCFRPLFFRMDENGERFGIVVRERIAGESLRNVIRRGLSRAEAMKISAELLAIVRALAEQHICHRDISLDRLTVCTDGHVRLSGFNFAVSTKRGAETRWLSRNLDVLAGLGGGYRIDAGRWNDALAIRICLLALPESPNRNAALDEIDALCKRCGYRVRLRHKFMLVALGRLIGLATHNFLRRCRGKMAKDKCLEAVLAHAFGLPVKGADGWRDLPAVFDALNENCRYVVLRNYEMLPDAFVPSLHGDIDLLVDDLEAVVRQLDARKVVKDPWRVHYEICVSGRPIRMDLRHVGDEYYPEAWERAILKNRRQLPEGIFVPSAEDAFHSLVYHAKFQKFAIAADYPGKVLACAQEAHIGGNSFDEWTAELVRFMRRNGYEVTHPRDRSVKYNAEAVRMAFSTNETEDRR